MGGGTLHSVHDRHGILLVALELLTDILFGIFAILISNITYKSVTSLLSTIFIRLYVNIIFAWQNEFKMFSIIYELAKKKMLVTQCVWLFVTPRPATCQSPLSMEFSRQEYWSRLLFTSLGDLPDPGTEPGSLALQADSLPSEPPGKPLLTGL